MPAPSPPVSAAVSDVNGNGAVSEKASGPSNVHATGQPDTPIEVITDLLQKALAGDSVEDVKGAVKKALAVAGGLDPYLEDVSSKPSELIKELITASMNAPWSEYHAQGKTIFKQKKECCAGSLEGQFLRSIVQLTRATSVLEVGMFTGTSTLAMAQALPDFGKVYALDIEPFLKEFTAPYFEKSGLHKRIEVVVGPASESIDKLARRGVRFDIAFLDADKSGYLGYYKQLMDNDLIVPGGIVVVDNSLMKGRVYTRSDNDEMAEAIREFNEYVSNDSRVDVVAIPLRDGINIVTRKPVQGDEIVQGVGCSNILQRFKLVSKVALITGAGQGIGRAFAHALGEAGAAVAVVDINKGKAEEVVKELRSKGIRAHAIQADVTQKKECKRMVEETVATLGGLHIAINNAGINKNASAEETMEEDWDATFALNTKGVFLSCQAEAEVFLQQKYGKIINTASMATLLVPHPQKQIAYNSSKAAVVKMTQTLACEWADRGVNVNCISPGIVETALITESPALKPLVSEWLSQIPKGRLASVADLQTAIVYLASDASNYMVGHNLVIEGGQSLW